MKEVKKTQLLKTLFIIVLLILGIVSISCQHNTGQGRNYEDVFPRGKEILIKKGYHDIIVTGSWPANDQNLNARTYFQAKDKDNNIIEGYFIEVDGKISTYVEKKDIKL
jgi:hypothetical protein